VVRKGRLKFRSTPRRAPARRKSNTYFANFAGARKEREDGWRGALDKLESYLLSVKDTRHA
jgi:hypothetical protein